MRKLNVLLIVCLVVIGAPAVRAQGTSGVNNAELTGNYAFTFNGMTTGGGGASTVFAAVGRFTADGAGNLTNGELDTNGVGPQEKLIAQTFTGTYQIGADHRGVMALNIPGGGTLAFAMMANGNAKFVEIDAAGGHGTVGSGTMEKADTTAYNTAKIVGDYAFGVVGLDGSNNRTAIAGRLTANGAGTFTNGASDVNQSGLFTTWNVFGANYMVTDTISGRGIMNLPPLAGGVPTNLNFVFYILNAGKLFAMETDAVTIATPLLNGVVLQQQSPIGGFSSASLSGGMVIYLTGRAGSGCAGGTGPASNVLAGLVSANGVGGLDLTYALLEGYEAVILVDALPRGGRPGTLGMIALLRHVIAHLAITGGNPGSATADSERSDRPDAPPACPGTDRIPRRALFRFDDSAGRETLRLGV